MVVVALAGKIHVARVGVSILTHAGIPELIAPDVSSYVRIAMDLAADEPRRAELRANLRVRMESSALMDARRVTRNIEQAYRSAWTDWCQS